MTRQRPPKVMGATAHETRSNGTGALLEHLTYDLPTKPKTEIS